MIKKGKIGVSQKKGTVSFKENRGQTTVLRFLEFSGIALLKYDLFFVIIRFCWPSDGRLSCKLLFIWGFIWLAVLELYCRISRCTLFSGETTGLRGNRGQTTISAPMYIGGLTPIFLGGLTPIFPIFTYF